MLATGRKDRLRAGWAYAVGAEVLSASLGDLEAVAGTAVTYVARYAGSTGEESRFYGLLHSVLEVDYEQDATRSARGAKAACRLRVTAVPSRLRSLAREVLVRVALPRVRAWILQPRTGLESSGGAYFACLVDESLPAFTIQTRSSRFADAVDESVRL